MSALDGVGSQRHATAAIAPGKTRYPLYRSLGGPQGRSGRVWYISPPLGFDPRTVLPVEIRYTDWAIPAHIINEDDTIFFGKCEATNYLWLFTYTRNMQIIYADK